MPRLRVLLPAALAALLLAFGGVLLVVWNSGGAMVVNDGVVTSRASVHYVYAVGRPSNLLLVPGLLAAALTVWGLCRRRALGQAWRAFLAWGLASAAVVAICLAPITLYRWWHFTPAREGRMLHARQLGDLERLNFARGAPPTPRPAVPPSVVGTSYYWYCWDAGPPIPHHLGHRVAGDHFCTYQELQDSGISPR